MAAFSDDCLRFELLGMAPSSVANRLSASLLPLLPVAAAAKTNSPSLKCGNFTP